MSTVTLEESAASVIASLDRDLLVATESSVSVLSVDAETAVLETKEAAVVVEATREVVVVETAHAQGPPGPPGPASEEEMPFAKRVDFVGDAVIYKGEAAVGSAESAPVWRIRRITLAGDDVTEEWAGGSAAFDKAWTDRAGESYS